MTENKGTLVIMAAGIGSRFGGGIKQLEPVGPNGEIIVDYSIYDAIEAGFNKVVFVIRNDLEEDFKEVIGNRVAKKVEVAYAYQEVSNIPSPYVEEFKGRTKPWGTGQAILACKEIVKEPFVVINADDYYGRDAYVAAYEYLTGIKEKQLKEIAMVSFVLKNTLSDFGAVTRGICKKNPEGYLKSIVETSNITKRGNKAVVIEGGNEEVIDVDALVSMNMWCFFPDFIDQLADGFEAFLKELKEEKEKAGKEQGKATYLKAEYLLPTIVGNLLNKGELAVKVLESKDQWFGVTYKEDKEFVVAEIEKLIESGLYT